MATRPQLTAPQLDQVYDLIEQMPCPLCLGVDSCLNAGLPLDGPAGPVTPNKEPVVVCHQNKYHNLIIRVFNTPDYLLAAIRGIGVEN